MTRRVRFDPDALLVDTAPGLGDALNDTLAGIGRGRVWLVTQGRPGGALTGDDAPDGFIAGFDGFMLPSPARLAIA